MKDRHEPDAWGPYEPSAEAPWDTVRVVHLHRRAGFAASWAEVRRDVEEGPEASVARVLDGKAANPHMPPDFEATSTLLADAATASGDPARLKAWWVYRMLFSPDPLGERLTLLWHDHFATSNAKVENLAAMRRQNDLFRRHARAPFAELLGAVVRDPAMLNWLDAPANRKGHPNENLARELMELFTLGVGHYTEADVKDAARALTGWTVVDGSFRDVEARRDLGEKTLLGRAGNWKGDDLVRIVLDQPATAHRLARRIGRAFFAESALAPSEIAGLGQILREQHLDIGRAMGTVLRSRAFFAAANLRGRVAGPVEFLLAPARALELLDPPPSTLVLADWAARLGQDLFYPPNVGGWPGGRSWLSARALIGRTNYTAALADGSGVGRPAPVDLLDLADRHGRGRGRDAALGFLATLLFGTDPGPGWRAQIASALGPESSWGSDASRRAVALALASPEAQFD